MTHFKIMILGASGMLGHKMLLELSKTESCYGTIRGNADTYKKIHPLLSDCSLIGKVDSTKFDSIESAINLIKPDVAVNCIGIVKQIPEAHDAIQSITTNSLFPHKLAAICAAKRIRLIHYSTDCVFSGNKGFYTEEDLPDPIDLYGRSKLLGEVKYENTLTLRTSLIGREIENHHSLLDWFLSQGSNTLKGFKYAIFSGLTTAVHALIVKEIIRNHQDLTGLYHVASDPISKYELLMLFKKYFKTSSEIIPDYSVKCNRSLDGSLLREKTKINIPCWEDMIRELSLDTTDYPENVTIHATK